MPPHQPHQIPISRFHVTCLFASPSCHQEILQSSSIRRVSSFLHATINSWLFNWVVMTTLFIYCHIQRSSDGSVTCSYLSTNFRSSCVWPAAAEPRHDRFSVEDPEQKMEWLFRRNVPPRQRWCYRVHISKIIGEFMLGSFRFRISDCIPWLSLGQRHRPYRRPARLEFRTIDRIFRPQQDDRGRRL